MLRCIRLSGLQAYPVPANHRWRLVCCMQKAPDGICEIRFVK